MPTTSDTILLTLTISAPKDGKPRKITVAGAPAGEMPIIIPGNFADRHALLDQAYAQLIQREPQPVTIKDATPAAAKHGTVRVTPEENLQDTPDTPEPAPDPTDLPKIESA